jgi:predicted dehydrogenase
MNRITRTQNLSRRHFLKATLAIAAAPVIIPGRALGLDGTVAPSNRIALGLIGVGGRMGAVWSALKDCRGVQGVAVCDVQEANRESYRKNLGLALKDSYVDYRDLNARADIDAVAIATPDHHHVPASIDAIRVGKDVYCEKPLSNTIREGRALVEAAARYGAVFQHGTQLHSMSGTRRACELVRNGRLGKLTEIRIGSPPGYVFGNVVPEPAPSGLNYDLWLGPAPVTPYHPVKNRRYPGVGLRGWYFVSEYSKAVWIAGVWRARPRHRAMGHRHGTQRAGQCRGRGVYPKDGLFDTVLTFEIVYEYANGVRIVMTDTGRNRHGVTFVGEKGTIFTRGQIEADPPSLLREVIGPNETHLYQTSNHAQNFIDCIRTRGETITPPEIAHRATSARSWADRLPTRSQTALESGDGTVRRR